MMTVSTISSVFGSYTVLDVLKHVDGTVHTIPMDAPVIEALVAFKALNMPAMVVDGRQGGIEGVITGYNLITFLQKVASKCPEKLWAALYKTEIYNIDWLTLQSETTTSLENLLIKMRSRGWGFTSIRSKGSQHLVSILDITKFLVSSGVFESISLRLLDIATSNVVTVRGDLTIFDLMGVMLRRRIRRVVLEGEDYIITDRGVLQYFVSDQTLQILRDRPEELMETTLDVLTPYVEKPEILSGDTPLSEVLKKLVEKEPYTVLTQDRKQILTPWDITKLLKQGLGFEDPK